MGLKAHYDFVLKVIVETGLLTPGELIAVLHLLEGLKVDFIKTSTGINSRGASLEDIQTIYNCQTQISIKASGGIKTLAFARQLIAAGAGSHRQQ